MTRSLPPSTGTCAPVVLEKSGPHISAASSATSRLVTSVRSTLLVLYASTVMPYCLARCASTSSVHRPVSNTALGCRALFRLPPPPHSPPPLPPTPFRP